MLLWCRGSNVEDESPRALLMKLAVGGKNCSYAVKFWSWWTARGKCLRKFASRVEGFSQNLSYTLQCPEEAADCSQSPSQRIEWLAAICLCSWRWQQRNERGEDGLCHGFWQVELTSISEYNCGNCWHLALMLSQDRIQRNWERDVLTVLKQRVWI